MGCFNVACSISNISIGAGDDVVFIPLVPPRFGRERYNHMLIYPYDLHNPFCLPVRGKYNDYGGLEEVVQDDNTEIVEKFLGITIEELMDCISRKGVYDTFSKMSEKFLPAFKLLANFSNKVDEAFFNAFGFIKLADIDGVITYEYGDKLLPYFITLSETEINIVDVEGTVKGTISFEHRKLDAYLFDDVLKVFANLSKYYVGVPEEKQDVVRLIESMSGMFIAGEIYDALIEKKYNDADSYGGTYEEALDKFIEGYKEIKILEEAKDKVATSLKRMFLYESRLFNYHESWLYFKALYAEPIADGKLREKLLAFNNFSSNMYSMNRFYFPGMNGEQHGNHRASLVLAEKTVEILKAKIKDYEEEYFEDEEDI